MVVVGACCTAPHELQNFALACMALLQREQCVASLWEGDWMLTCVGGGGGALAMVVTAPCCTAPHELQNFALAFMALLQLKQCDMLGGGD
jgi:hypothetical protein